MGFGLDTATGFEVRRFDYSLTPDGKVVVERLKNRYAEEWAKIVRTFQTISAADNNDYVALSLAAKTFFILTEARRPLTTADVAAEAARIGWRVSEEDADKAARLFGSAGLVEYAENHRPETHLIPVVLQAALGVRPEVTIFGNDYPTPDGTCIRNYVHVTDLAVAHLLALKALAGGYPSAVYNLGSGRGFSVREVIEAAQHVTGRDFPVVEGPRRPGDPGVLVACSRSIKQELGWSPRYVGLRRAEFWRIILVRSFLLGGVGGPWTQVLSG